VNGARLGTSDHRIPFRSKAKQIDRTELMVLITPRLVRPLNAGELPPLPQRPEGFLPPLEGSDRPAGGTADAPVVTSPNSGGER
jgi:hypothetical protein